MARSPRQGDFHRYESRITRLLKSFEEDLDTESQAHNAKYLAVLISGYLEQAIKELLLNYASQGARPQILRYVEKTWPISRNMKAENIQEILGQFNDDWSKDFLDWLVECDSRKSNINSLVTWRNRIAHGQESNTTGVTLVSVKNAFDTVKDLVSFVDLMVKQ